MIQFAITDRARSALSNRDLDRLIDVVRNRIEARSGQARQRLRVEFSKRGERFAIGIEKRAFGFYALVGAPEEVAAGREIPS